MENDHYNLKIGKKRQNCEEFYLNAKYTEDDEKCTTNEYNVSDWSQ